MPTILATAGYDHTIRLWEVSSGHCYRTLQFQDSAINRLAITPNRQHIAAAGNPMIRLYELNSNNPQPISTFNGHKGNVVALGFPKDGRWMYSGSDDGMVKIWDLRNPASSRDFSYTDPCTGVVLHPNQRHLFCTYQNGTVRILDTQPQISTDVPEFIPSTGDTSLQSVDIDPTGRFCALVNTEGMCFIYSLIDLKHPKLIKEWKAHDKYILKCLFSPDCQYLVTTSADHTAKIWQVNNEFQLEKQLHGHQRWVWDCAFGNDPSTTYLFSVSSDHVARQWDVARGQTVRQFSGHRKSVTCLALHHGPENEH